MDAIQDLQHRAQRRHARHTLAVWVAVLGLSLAVWAVVVAAVWAVIA